MKSKYVFIRNHAWLKPGDFIYHVWVGSSRREQAKYLLVREFCRDCGIYFKMNSLEVCSDIEQARNKFRKDGNYFADPFRSASLSISELYRMIIDDSFNAFEENQVETKSSLWWNFHCDPDYIQAVNRSNVLQNASPSERKNLSIRKRVKRHETDLLFNPSNV